MPARRKAAVPVERFYRQLYRIRKVEEEVARVYPTDKVKSPVHLSIGQEAVSVGLCEALRPEDVVFGTYRGHALYLAKGGDLKSMIAELYGKSTGCAKGKGGSMHLIDSEHGMMGASAVVGTTIPHAVGCALALKLQGKRAVVASVFGDGAVDEGVWHESMNFAALKKLPVLFLCENNLYAIHSRQRDRQPTTDLCARARSYGMPAHLVADGDVFKLHARARAAVEAMRSGRSGPVFIECRAYRWKEHVGPAEDWQHGYRSRKEAEPWLRRDPVELVGRKLAPAARRRVRAEVDAEVRDAFEYAELSPFPEPDQLYTDVFDSGPRLEVRR